MPYIIRIKNDSVYHNEKFVKSYPPEFNNYLNLLKNLQSNTSPDVKTKPFKLTEEYLKEQGQKLFDCLFGNLPTPNQPILLDIDKTIREIIPFEILHDGKNFLANTIGIVRIYQTGNNILRKICF